MREMREFEPDSQGSGWLEGTTLWEGIFEDLYMQVRSSKHQVETAADWTKGKRRAQSVQTERGGQVELRVCGLHCSPRTRWGLK